MSAIQSLPDEVLVAILSYIHVIERLPIRTVCKKFKDAVDCQLSATDSLQFLGKSIRSMLDFVTDAKKKELRCREHFIPEVNSIRAIGNFDLIALTTSKYFTRIKYLRLHKMTLTWDGFKVMTDSSFWTESLQHLDIKSCYLEDPQCQVIAGRSITIINRADVLDMKRPAHLRHFNLILMSEQEDLLFILEYLTRDLKAKHEQGDVEGIIYNVQTPRHRHPATNDNGVD